jgi:hypothetical protein
MEPDSPASRELRALGISPVGTELTVVTMTLLLHCSNRDVAS